MNFMKYIYRNSTAEPLFPTEEYAFSGYEDFSLPADQEKYTSFVFFIILPRWYEEDSLCRWIDDYEKRVESFVAVANGRPVYVFALQNYFCPQWEFSGHVLKRRIAAFNMSVAELAQNFHLLDLADFSSALPYDAKYYYLYSTVVAPQVAADFRAWFTSQINKFSRPAKKCLILDLDNTLWGGILEEDGMEKLKISGNYPSSVYQDFQRLVLAVKKTGVVLCIASKNDEEKVKKCFEQRDDLLVKWEDFVSRKIHWGPKDQSVREIAQELGIGLDSMVFIDDNAAERERVKTFCPGVEVPDFPQEEYKRPDFFAKQFEIYFAKNKVSIEDKSKTELYLKKLNAEAERKKFTTENEYLAELNTRLSWQELNSANQERMAELINKSNRFNLTARRYTIAELKKADMALCAEVTDKFGPLGLNVALVLKIDGENAFIESFALSCRVLGRRIEYQTVEDLLSKLRWRGVHKVYGRYVPTEKNKSAADFYTQCGFTMTEQCPEYTEFMKDII